MLRSAHPCLKRRLPDPIVWTSMPRRFRQLQMDTTRTDEKKTLATSTANLEHVTKVSKEQDVKKRNRRLVAEANESALHGSFLEVEEGTCPNADWTTTLLIAARSRTRKLFFQTSSVCSLQERRLSVQGHCRITTPRRKARDDMHVFVTTSTGW